MDVREFARREALRLGVDPGHILPLVGTESSWNTNAVSPKGAAGLMQLMPATARDLGLSDADRFNPAKAIPAGIRYYKQQLDRFGTPELAYAAYNAGPGAVMKAGGVPNIRETQDYVRKNAMAPKTSLSVDDAAALLQGGAGAKPTAKALSLDDAAALLTAPSASAKPARKPLKVIDNTKPLSADQVLAESTSLRIPGLGTVSAPGWLTRSAIGAGKAGTDFLNGIGVGGMLGLQEGNKKADAALSKDVPAQAGNLLGQAGIMYVGGTALKGAGAGMKAVTAGRDLTRLGKVVQAGGNALSKAGSAAINPANYKQAIAAGAGYGAIAQPGDLGERLANAAAGGIGGAAGMAVGRGVMKVADKAAGMLQRKALPQLEQQLQVKLQADGIDYNALPQAIKKQLQEIGRRSLDALDNLDTKQLRSMNDFAAAGITPTRGWLTRNPKDWWMENNLNTVDDQLSARFRDANTSLVNSVSDGTSQATDYDLGNKLQDTFQGYDQALKAKADRLYSAARDMTGRDIPLDPHRFVNGASIELDQQMLGSKLPADTLGWFQKVTGGQEPFDMGTALQRLQAINGRIYGTHDPAEAKALGIVKKHLTDAIEGYGGPQAGGIPRVVADPQQQLADAFRGARAAAADRFRFQESSPLVDQVLKGKFTPEKLPKMLGSMRIDDLKGLAAIEQQRGVPVMATLRDAAKAFIRDSATKEAETGGTFSMAGYRKALNSIGPEKGELLFGKDGWKRYDQILNAAGAIHNAPNKPVGSPTFANFMRLINGMGNIPIAGRGVNFAVTGISKLKQMDDVARALNPSISVPMPAQPSRLPLLTTPLGLLTYDQAK